MRNIEIFFFLFHILAETFCTRPPTLDTIIKYTLHHFSKVAKCGSTTRSPRGAAAMEMDVEFVTLY